MRSRRSRHAARGGRSRIWRVVAALLIGLGATLASSTVRQETVARYADIDSCVTGCPVAAAGWPLPYLVDNPGLSPATEASLTGAAMGVDRFRPEAFALDLLGWTLLAGLVVAVLGRLRR